MPEQFRRVGAGPDPFVVKPRFAFTPAELVELSVLDPTDPVDRARLRGVRRRVEMRSAPTFGAPTPDELLHHWLMEWQESAAAAAPEQHPNPVRLDGDRPQRGLEPGDFEFVRTMAGVDPERIPNADARHLSELEAAAKSESERRVLSRVLDPVRRIHDRREEEGELRAGVAGVTASRRWPEVRTAVERLLADRLAEERRGELAAGLAELPPRTPEHVRDALVRDLEAEVDAARRQAPALLRERWERADAEVAEQTTQARDRLIALAGGADPVSSASLPPLPDPSLIEARERGRAHAAERAGRQDAFAGFRSVGTDGSGSAA